MEIGGGRPGFSQFLTISQPVVKVIWLPQASAPGGRVPATRQLDFAAASNHFRNPPLGTVMKI